MAKEADREGAAELALGCLSLELVAQQWRIVSSTCEDEDVITVHLSEAPKRGRAGVARSSWPRQIEPH